jgi:sugar-specific transcriptional regulator TrmB
MLTKFGFTPTEDKIYQELLRLGPSTGYVVARELGIARANVYQALESLLRRSAVRKTATSPVQYSAVGPAALLGEFERSFKRDLADLEEGLRSLPLAGAKAGELEQVISEDRLLARASSCIDAARSEILAVLGPWAQPLFPRLAAAERRRVGIRVLSLGEPAPERATVRAVPADALREYWGGNPVVVIADMDRAVCGIISGSSAGGMITTMPGIIPFFRHLVRRELAGQPSHG